MTTARAANGLNLVGSPTRGGERRDHPTRAVPESPRDALDAAMGALARASGAWIVVERLGTVLGHVAGIAECPAGAREALLSRRIEPLRDAVRWSAGAERFGVLGGLPVRVEQLDEDARAWVIGGSGAVPPLDLLRDALPARSGAIYNPTIARLLEPNPTGGPAPLARLVVIDGPDTAGTAARLARATVNALGVHHESGRVLVALAADEPLLALRRFLPCSAVASMGVSCVPEGSPDWSRAFRLAHAACDFAGRRGLPLADTADPAVMAELVLEVAAAAAQRFADDLHFPALARLKAHDRRTGGALMETLAAWCRSDGNTANTARDLHVHINTLRYRLRRASEVAGLDTTYLPQRLALQLLVHATAIERHSGRPSSRGRPQDVK